MDSPKLSQTEYRTYNRMAEVMEYYVKISYLLKHSQTQILNVPQHSHFRQTWKLLYEACSNAKRPAQMSIRQFLNTGLTFCNHLHAHHSIEEMHIFPVLARKMPAFQEELELLTQHKQIHSGLEKFQAYLQECIAGERELRMEEMKSLMDDFGKVLWAHLADEVDQLAAENMRKYWTVAEMEAMPI